MTDLRPPAVAGSFYPGEPGALGDLVAELLRAAPAPRTAAPPKALIAPHAGYVYSGALAARAYAALRPATHRVTRVVLLGPSHFVHFRGLAAPATAAFATPLGPVPLDRAALDGLAELPQVAFDDEPHRREHALEVQLPFLQAVLGDFALVPLVIGEAEAAAVAEAIARLWGGPETVIVASSDLSHFHDEATAHRRDAATAAAITGFAGGRLDGADACGHLAIAGLLHAAQEHGLRIEPLGLATSADAGGPRERVVGYGAWALYETAPAAT
jgi:hypothetical protein